MTDRELMDRAWDYLAAYTVGERPNASDVNNLIFALENRLSQPEPKPVTYQSYGLMGGDEFVSKDSMERNNT
jgi:hypothetical protein